jgi:hypothetical protein
MFPSLSHCRVSPDSHLVSLCLQLVCFSMLFLFDRSLIRDARVILRVPAWQLSAADSTGRCGVFVAEFLLFPIAEYDLSRISSLFACSLCMSPCSLFSQPNGWWLLLLSLDVRCGVEFVLVVDRGFGRDRRFALHSLSFPSHHKIPSFLLHPSYQQNNSLHHHHQHHQQ